MFSHQHESDVLSPTLFGDTVMIVFIKTLATLPHRLTFEIELNPFNSKIYITH